MVYIDKGLYIYRVALDVGYDPELCWPLVGMVLSGWLMEGGIACVAGRSMSTAAKREHCRVRVPVGTAFGLITITTPGMNFLGRCIK